jgi:DNA polymerase-3 subunit alpha
VVSNIRDVTTKKKDLMAYVTLEDLKGSITAIFFADVYRKASDLLHGDEPILVKGIVDVGEDSIKVIAAEVQLLSEALDLPFQAASFRFDTTRLADHDLEALRNLLRKHPGKAEGFIHLLDERSETVIHLGKGILFAPSKSLKEEADRILGTGATQFR